MKSQSFFFVRIFRALTVFSGGIFILFYKKGGEKGGKKDVSLLQGQFERWAVINIKRRLKTNG